MTYPKELRKRVEEKLNEPAFQLRLRLVPPELREKIVEEIMKELWNDWLNYKREEEDDLSPFVRGTDWHDDE